MKHTTLNTAILIVIAVTLAKIQSQAQNLLLSTGNVGVGTTTPKEQFQIGDIWTFHNGGSKFIGYNCFYDGQLKKLKSGFSSQISFDGNGDMFFKTGGQGAANAVVTLNTSIILKNDGNVGIGHESPTERLDVNGNVRARGNFISGGADFRLGVNDGRFQGTKLENRAMVHYSTIPALSQDLDGLIINYNGDFEHGVDIQGPQLHVYGKTIINENLLVNKKMIVGNLFETESNMPPGYALYVRDGILTEKIKVAAAGTPNWADYVFEKDYCLMPLKELEAYIQTNKHLPNIPSSEEVAALGIDLAQINAKLLEKVEELTLHLIEQQKQIEALKKQNEEILVKVNTSKN